ncbi:MAG: DUF2989 domain-containing protein [Pseudomonadota bacterium]|uniref:DUF2989 domain-containing protein n=1 Tax=Gallaecimonas pentaromativorans TaxID=584787 RepID=UPI00067F11E9|nr:DUF2989 domain-containing protein [Gallaecimonas pentaromativorans]MED5525974.1 DUF2989 domain-containing protein [Pseudomonadota bacterium]
MKKLLCLVPLTLLVACKSEPSLQEICTDYPALCARLNTDGWCRNERSELIRQRYDVSQLTADPGYQGYRLLLDTEAYRDCMAKASGVVHKNLKERQSARGEAYIESLKDLKALQEQYKGSQDPHLLYYRFTRFEDEHALKLFLLLEGTGAFNTLELKTMLAGYYAKSDREKTFRLLIEGLALPRESSTINPEIFQTLATLSMQSFRYQDAYLWTRIAQRHGVAIDPRNLEQYLKNDEKRMTELDALAEGVDEAISENRFDPKMAELDPQPGQDKASVSSAAQSSAPPN